MNKLLNKYKEIKKTRKGFTLVELLVVIAILAVLASVSVVGYLGFTTKAKNSNAMTELAQVREILRGELVDGAAHNYKYDSTGKKFTEVSSLETSDAGLTLKYSTDTSTSTSKKTLEYKVSSTLDITWDAALEGIFTELKSLDGTFYVEATESSITSISYVTTAGGKANWTVATDSLDSDSVNKAVGSNTATQNANKVGKYPTA